MSLQSAANDAAELAVATDVIETSDAIRELDGVMQSLAAVFHAEGDIGQARFRRLTRDLLANHPSVQALQSPVVVPDRHRKAFERELRAAGLGSSINDPTPEGIPSRGSASGLRRHQVHRARPG
ncbi:MAG: hypothetical protein U0R64_09340 [Candidatus Nanopelagicales bacterium]